jgi:hypothetical protein
VLCILAKKNESLQIFRIIKIIDPQAFVSQSAVIGVYGEGFDEMRVKIKEIKKIDAAIEKTKKNAKKIDKKIDEIYNKNKAS